MEVCIFRAYEEMSRAAAQEVADVLNAKPNAVLGMATGSTPLGVYQHLVKMHERGEIDFSHVTTFNLDEYVGLPITHPASFRLYLWHRFVSKLPLPLANFHYVNAEKDPHAECARLGKIIQSHPIDVAFIGIGENAHIAFNDPPADFDTEEPYLVVQLDDACRQQQMGEGWFPTLNDVPQQAISMSVRQILKSKSIICTVPDQRKAQAVKDSVQGPITNKTPASILQRHQDMTLYLDPPAASLLK